MRKSLLNSLLLTAMLAASHDASAQLSKNPDKFLGNITTSYQVDYGNEPFYTLWNQITPENESKWASVEGTRNSFNWGFDGAYKYAVNHGFPFKFHCLVWGSQYPSWIESLTPEQRYKEVVEWMDAVKAKYPDLPLIDVVNEAVEGHQQGTHFFIEALGGTGKTGYDWIIKAFELAHERWPDAILIYNDFNTFQWQKNEFITLVRTLRDAGAPIDAYGCQSHDLTDMSASSFKSAMTEIQNALKMPMYSTEYDIGTSDDALQLQRYKEQIPYIWEAEYCAGITLWGYIYGKTWTTDGNSGIIKNGKDRPAMKWLREYMATDAAKNAKGPFKNFKKEASLYVGPANGSLNVEINKPVKVRIRASLRTKTIDHIDFYVNNVKVSAPVKDPENEGVYYVEYTPTTLGKFNLKAVLVDTEGTEYERLSSFTANNPRGTFKGEITVPGVIEAENFDTGADGIAFHDSDTKREGDGASYRSNGGGVDVVKMNGGYGIGYTAAGEWMEYTVNVKEAGLYSFDVYASSGAENSTISFDLSDGNSLTALAGPINIPCIETGNWDNYRTVHGRFVTELKEGSQVIRVTINNAGCNLDKFTLTRLVQNPDMNVKVSSSSTPAYVDEYTTLKVNVTSDTSKVAYVNIYADNVFLGKLTGDTYEYNYKPTVKGTVAITAIAVDEYGQESNIGKLNLSVNIKRGPYKSLTLPGTIEVEYFDKGGEGISFHDSDSQNEGDASRSDGEGVDLVKANGGTVLGYTAVDEWLEYTVNVTEAGIYKYEAVVSSGATGSGFNISLHDTSRKQILAKVSVPQTADGSWDTYKTVSGELSKSLTAGQHIILLTITGANCNIDKIKFTCVVPDGIKQVTDGKATYAVYTTSGVYVGQFSVDGDTDFAGKLRQLTRRNGVYVLKNKSTGDSRLIKTAE